MLTKFFLTSKTILGGLIAGLPGTLEALGVSLPELPQFLEAIVASLDTINEAVGLAVVVWGRVTAVKTITLLPKGS